MAFIVFEGLDGSGKSTLIHRLNQFLMQHQIQVVLTREPGGTPLAEEIRKLVLARADGEVPCPRTEVLLYQASRAQHVEQVIRPALARCDWVLCDRFYASTISFQSYGRSLDRKDIDLLNNYAVSGTHPDLTVLIDLTVAASRQRLESRLQKNQSSIDRIEAEALSFHEKVRLGYLAQARELPDSWLVLDGLQSPEELFQSVCHELKKRGWM
jgi:dTMP kinase